MGRNAVGFYWTLPVPWAGFMGLPDGIEDAAKASKTIRYQVQRIRNYAREEGFTLIREEVFLEVQPDRGTDSVISALEKLEHYCRTHAATLLYIDFSEAQGWRSHPPMEEWSRGKRIAILPILPEPEMIGGKTFDPAAHFRDWRKRQEAWSEGKAGRLAAALKAATGLRETGLAYARIATVLNETSVQSATGKPWTGEMVRKLLQSAKATP